MSDKLKIVVYTYDSATEAETEVTDSPVFLDYDDGVDQDAELEIVHDRNGNPIVRPKQAPKY